MFGLVVTFSFSFLRIFVEFNFFDFYHFPRLTFSISYDIIILPLAPCNRAALGSPQRQRRIFGLIRVDFSITTPQGVVFFLLDFFLLL